jgi:hypothetical protein
VLSVLVVVLALMGLVVAGVVRPLRDEASLTTMRVETLRAFYAAESGAMVVAQGYMGRCAMPGEGEAVTINAQTVVFAQVPDAGGVAVVEGMSGDATRRIELMLE